MPSPVRALTRTTAAPGTSSRASSSASSIVSAVDGVDLRQGDDAALDAEQPEDRQVLVRLRSRALPRVDHEQEEVDARRAGDHRPDEPLVPRHVDQGEPASVDELERRVPEVDRDAAPLLLREAVRVLPGHGSDEPGLAVVDVPGGADRQRHLRVASRGAGTGSRPRGRGAPRAERILALRRSRASARSRHRGPDGPSVLTWRYSMPRSRRYASPASSTAVPRPSPCRSRRTPITYTSAALGLWVLSAMNASSSTANDGSSATSRMYAAVASSMPNQSGRSRRTTAQIRERSAGSSISTTLIAARARPPPPRRPLRR